MKFVRIFLVIALCLFTGIAKADIYGPPGSASDIETNTTNFDNNLSTADTDVQKALDTLDAMVGGSGAPTTATYLTSTANGTLSNEVDLGALSSGFLYGTVAGGISTISSVATAAVTNGAATLSTGDQIYDFVVGQGYLTAETNNLETVTTGIASGEIPIGTSAGVSTYTAVSGDAALSSTGVLGVNKTRLNVRNETGVQIASTKVVYASGFNNFPLISLADNTDETKHDTLGLTIAPINHEANGFIATNGQCDAETNTWVVGTTLYLSTSGALTSTMPTSGAVKIVGIVTVQANYPTGKILLSPRLEENITAGGANTDVILRTGDAIGVNKISFRDYANAEVAYIDSNGVINSSPLTASEILITDASKNIVSAPVATYPSLTELSYVKGLSSAIQTQLGTKAATATTITIAGTANQITSSAGAQDLSANRTWTLSLPADVLIPTILTTPNTGLHILDTNASHDLIVKPGSDLTADKTLTITTGDADKILDLTAVTDEYVLAYDVGTNTWRGVVTSGGTVTYSKSFIITNPTSSADGALWKTPAAITITAVHGVEVGGTNIIGHLTECDADGLNPAGVDGATDITITTSNVNDDGTLSNPSIDANDYVGWRTTSVSGTVTKAIISFDYTID